MANLKRNLNPGSQTRGRSLEKEESLGKGNSDSGEEAQSCDLLLLVSVL